MITIKKTRGNNTATATYYDFEEYLYVMAVAEDNFTPIWKHQINWESGKEMIKNQLELELDQLENGKL